MKYHDFVIPWGKNPANQLICWLAPEAISEDKLPGVLFPFFFLGISLG